MRDVKVQIIEINGLSSPPTKMSRPVLPNVNRSRFMVFAIDRASARSAPSCGCPGPGRPGSGARKIKLAPKHPKTVEALRGKIDQPWAAAAHAFRPCRPRAPHHTDAARGARAGRASGAIAELLRQAALAEAVLTPS